MPWPVRMTTGTSGAAVCIRRTSSRPSAPGMRRSESTTSTGARPRCASASATEAGRAHLEAARAQDLDEGVADVRLVLDDQDPPAAAGAFAHRLKPPPRAPPAARRAPSGGAGRLHPEDRPAALARPHVELAVVLAHDRMTDRQAEARRVLGREERLEDALPVGLGDAGAAVGELGHDPAVLAARADPHLAPLRLHLARVHDQVHHHLARA